MKTVSPKHPQAQAPWVEVASRVHRVATGHKSVSCRPSSGWATESLYTRLLWMLAVVVRRVAPYGPNTRSIFDRIKRYHERLSHSGRDQTSSCVSEISSQLSDGIKFSARTSCTRTPTADCPYSGNRRSTTRIDFSVVENLPLPVRLQKRHVKSVLSEYREGSGGVLGEYWLQR